MEVDPSSKAKEEEWKIVQGKSKKKKAKDAKPTTSKGMGAKKS